MKIHLTYFFPLLERKFCVITHINGLILKPEKKLAEICLTAPVLFDLEDIRLKKKKSSW